MVIVSDAVRKFDPTGTAGIRRSFRADLSRRWQHARRDVLRAVGEADGFGLERRGSYQIGALAQGGGSLHSFQNWLEGTLRQTVIAPGGIDQYIQRGYFAGVDRAERMLKVRNAYLIGGSDVISVSAMAELNGIMNAVVQYSVREMHAGMQSRARPMAVARSIVNRLDKIGATRSKALANVAVIQAHAAATLDIMQAAGVRRVGLIPEYHIHVRRAFDHDHSISDAKRKRRRFPARTALTKILRAETRLASLETVNVLTAGDDDVCEICEGIAANGPYDIDSARSLIPAHPNCRCAFVPAEDKRFAKDHTPGGHEHNQKNHAGGQWKSQLDPESVAKLRIVEPGDTVDGLVVREDIPNQSSISASMEEYEELPGIREVPMSAFEAGLEPYSSNRTSEFKRTHALAEEIKENGEINPLIVVVEAFNVEAGPYVLEGGHRFDAMRILGKKSLPAKVVIDYGK